MYLRRLTLTNFRNYPKQVLDLSAGTVLLLGENAQGKTNLIEAVILLATGRSERAAVDAEYIAWDVRGDDQPFARLEGLATRAAGDISVELAVIGREGATGRLIASKRFKLNGAPKRSADVVGTIMAVLFTTDDMDLVRGAPAGRRRYLDVMLTQADRQYARALHQYSKLLSQRNALLKRIQEGSATRGELAYWDEELSREGATVLKARATAVGELAPSAASVHRRLSGEREHFALMYEPRLAEGWGAADIAASPFAGIERALREKLEATHGRDIGAGITLTGPHRDDVAMTLDGESAVSFASRGQQRTAALALRLAESKLLYDRSGERPILLLDDVLSELDESRRESVLSNIEADQVIITSADRDRFAHAQSAHAFQVAHGTVGPD